jgi:hypothetical protein
MRSNLEAQSLNAQLARAFGLPKRCRRAVLTLEVGELPRWELEVYAIGSTPTRFGASDDAVEQVLRIPFVLRRSTVEGVPDVAA